MIRINQDYFFKIIDIENNDIRIENKIPEIDSKDINEFKIGKNYFYRVVENYKLIAIQKKLNAFLMNHIELNGAAVAFRNGHSYLNLFEPHRKNYFFLRLDVRSFFHSINIDDIKKALNTYFTHRDNEEEKSIEAFLKIISYKIPEKSPNEKFRNKKILPVGFVTSPVISNIVFRKIDIQIQKFCSGKNIIYTRYADDMLFSSSKEIAYVHSDNFINEIRILISQLGLKLNAKKTLKAKHTLSLNGYVIQNEINKIKSEIRISNKKTKIIKKLIYLRRKKKVSPQKILKKLFRYEINQENFRSIPTEEKIKKYYDDQLKNKVSGYRSYLISIIKFNIRYNCTSSATIKEFIEMIKKLNLIIKEL